MSKTLDHLHKLLESLPEKDLEKVRDFAEVLSEQPEELTEEERKSVRKGKEEFRRGQWVKWESVKRQDV